MRLTQGEMEGAVVPEHVSKPALEDQHAFRPLDAHVESTALRRMDTEMSAKRDNRRFIVAR